MLATGVLKLCLSNRTYNPLYTVKGEPVRQVGQLKSDEVYVAAVGKYERADYGRGLPQPQLPIQRNGGG